MSGRLEFAERHGLDPQILLEARLDRDDLRRCWSMPIFDVDGGVVGTRRLFDNGHEASARGSGEGHLWVPSRFHNKSLVFLVSGVLNTLAVTAAGFDAIGLISDSKTATASIYPLVRKKDVLIAVGFEKRLRVAEKIAERVSTFASCTRVAVVPGGPAAFLRESPHLDDFWKQGQRVGCKIRWNGRATA